MEYLIVAAYEDENGKMIAEVFAEGFDSLESAEAERQQMRNRVPEVSLESMSRAYYESMVRIGS